MIRKIIVWLRCRTGIRRCMNCGRIFRRKYNVFCSNKCYDYVMLEPEVFDEHYPEEVLR